MTFFALILLQFSAIQSELLTDLKRFQVSDGIEHGTVAASIHRVSDNKPVLSFNEEKGVNSASTLKLITTATILNKLGSGFRYKTDLFYTGQISNNSLNGDLLIEGNGDPSFGSERGRNPYDQVLDDIYQTLNTLGIKEINGNIIIDDETVFEFDAPDSWIWGDMGNYYGALPHKFNINENFFRVYFDPGNSVGANATVKNLIPFDPDWQIINLVKTGTSNSGDQVYIYSNPNSEVLILKGTVPLGRKNFPVKGSIPNPAKLFRVELLKMLEKKGIEVADRHLTPLAADLPNSQTERHLIKRFLSQTLEELSQDCNFSSINLYADAFLHTTSLADTGFENFNDALKSLRSHWEERVSDLAGFNPKDGSGLSPSGYITASNMTNILSAMSKEVEYESFLNTIPVLGQEGSVRYKDRQKRTDGRVKAKSGSIESTRAFAGYFTDKQGTDYAFMVAVNRYEPDASSKVRSFLDNFLVKMGTK
ncbi:D-alanyl-D-alanine carboxypeptidase/D-alanyl-D-alanine endopeptidase [Arcticibacterium luteifluviistationis]|uniref:D-alanyl-D-alanine carboxypeptidase/D-alanyl-D-alanine-endopeptidase n=1 Tax=Arcticibacterium luteifluviistationis TaxID=1784714 RepID=A0A2Z4GBT9_9BACT|nr:D-alanyl-D-alanine carboxypeptidase/D-alanyl-D-alanine-endopeptidase [Arcticibacterium luteifluviistationis]AWV98666.1 D-alanyl-D-alanine carboxypeptidase/D-alanyl-D-alanine-endopeptidase [Arcticibacterium luteifluviistationis]